MKNIIITGASRGIGFQTARLLVYKGNNVIAVARNEKGLQSLIEDCKGMKGSLQTIKADVLKPEEITQQLKKQHQKVDVLINNAATFLKKDLDELNMQDLEYIYSVNVFAPILLVKELRPLMEKGSHIINISSMGGVQGSVKFQGLLPYSSSKGALNTITECLAVELQEEGITCNALALGSSSTEMFKSAFPNAKAATTPSQMARFIVNFVINSAHMVNGKVIQVSNQTP